MEKEDSTDKEPVGSPAPEDVKKVDAPEGEDHNIKTSIKNELLGDEKVGTTNEGEDHNINTPIKNELSGDEMVGTTNDTNEESLEKKHVIHEEHQDREPSTTEHLLDNEPDETAADDQKLASDIHSLDREIETSSKRHLVDDANDMEIRSREENMSTDSSTPSSLVGPSNSENSISVPGIQKEDQEKDNSVNNTTISSTASDIDIRGQEEEHSTNNSHSNSENSINPHTGAPGIQKEDQEKDNSVNNTTVSSTGRDIDIRGQEEEHFTNNSLINSENSINAPSGVPDIQKEDQDKDILVNTTTISSTARDIDIKGQKEEHSPNNSLSNSENSISDPIGAPEIQKEDQEKDNSVNNTTISPDASNIDIRGQEEEHSTNTSHSNSENSTIALTDVPHIQKEDQEKDKSVNYTTISSTATDIDIRDREEEHSTKNTLSDSKDSINTHTDEPDIKKEDQEKDNSINDITLNSIPKEGEILDHLKDKEDQEHSSEPVKVNHQPTEKMEMETHQIQEESKDVSHVTSADDDEKIGDDLNNHKGITKNSSSEETGDTKTDPKDNTSSKKEEALVVYGTQQPTMESGALTKFVKMKSLYAVSNVFRRLSKKADSNEKNKNIKEAKSDERENQEVIPSTSKQDEGSKKEVTLESMESIAIKGRVVLYTRLWCQDCKEARLFLRKKRLRYSEINVDVYPSRKLELEKMTGSSDVPRVFFNQVLIGGLNDLKGLDESGKLQEKIEYVTSQGPSPKGPLPPFSGEDDVSSRGIVDELAVIVRKMKESIAVKDRFYKFRRVTNCFLGSEAVDFLSEDQFLEREEAIQFARKLAKELFFRHVLEENTFEDGNHLYRFLDQDPVISQCQNIPRGIIQSKRQPLVELSHRMRVLLYAILEAYISEDGRHVAYRTIHGSEEFARFLRIAEELQRVDLTRTAKEERLAFFINLYNLMAIHAILVWGHPEGALDRRKLFNEFKYVIGGCAYSLSDIYNGILRANQRPPYTLIKPFGLYDKRFKVSLPYPEPLIHFALVSGNRSAPALRCYSPKNIDVELMQAANDFLKSRGFVLQLDSMTISVTKILKWYSVDFGKKEVEVLKHAANYLEVEKTQKLLELLDSSQLKVVYQPYDWRLNS